MLRKYGKDMNMRFLKRDLGAIKQMIESCAKFSRENLAQLDEKKTYNCRICHSKSFSKFTNVRGYEYVQCADCGSIVLLNIPDVRKLYEKEGTIASTIYLDEEVFQRRVETIALPKIKFIVEMMNGGGGGGHTMLVCGGFWCVVLVKK
jgi:DNA-directed RNA polymerase subunit RPC12/RpoP